MSADAVSDGTEENVSWDRWGRVALYLTVSLLLALAFVHLIREVQPLHVICFVGPDELAAQGYLQNAIAPCANDAMNPVNLEVTRFASSLNFAGYSQDTSNELNNIAANRRAQNVRMEIYQTAQ